MSSDDDQEHRGEAAESKTERGAVQFPTPILDRSLEDLIGVLWFRYTLGGRQHRGRTAQGQPGAGGQDRARVRGQRPPERRRRPLLDRRVERRRLDHELPGIDEIAQSPLLIQRRLQVDLQGSRVWWRTASARRSRGGTSHTWWLATWSAAAWRSPVPATRGRRTSRPLRHATRQSRSADGGRLQRSGAVRLPRP